MRQRSAVERYFGADFRPPSRSFAFGSDERPGMQRTIPPASYDPKKTAALAADAKARAAAMAEFQRKQAAAAVAAAKVASAALNKAIGDRPGQQRIVVPSTWNPAEALRLKAAREAEAARLAKKKKEESQSFLTKAVNSAGRAVSGAVNAVTSTVASIPVVGPGLAAVVDLSGAGALKLAADIAQGKNVSQAAVSNLKSQVQSVRDVAPYAQMVVSMVPGVGTGVAAAIGAASALAAGQPISEAIVAGVRGALPGGPLAKAAFDVAHAAATGKAIDVIAINALPIGDAEKRALVSGLQAARDLAAGRPVSATLLNAGRANLPPDISRALDIGIAIGQGQNLQKVVVKAVTSPAAISALASVGSKAGGAVVSAGRDLLGAQSPNLAKGFDVGVGLMAHSGVNAPVLASVRSVLPASAQQGFDTAVATYTGLVQNPPPALITDAAERFAYAVTSGLNGASQPMKQAIVSTIANPLTTRAIVAAASTVQLQNDVLDRFEFAREFVRRTMLVLPNGRIARKAA